MKTPDLAAKIRVLKPAACAPPDDRYVSEDHS